MRSGVRSPLRSTQRLLHLGLENLLHYCTDHFVQPLRVRQQNVSLTAALVELPSVLVMLAFLRGNRVTLNITSLP